MICVECGLKLESDSLYVEYSERNIKLVRCDKCHNVADKYIEYELLLVSIDLILLREQAYRHILFNRSLLNRASVGFIPSLMASVILISLLLKMVVAEQWVAKDLEEYSFLYPAFLLLVSLVEHIAFVGAAFIVLKGWCAPCTKVCDTLSPACTSTISSTPSLPVLLPGETLNYNKSQIANQGSTHGGNSFVITKGFYRKVYVALTFPELAKLVILLLQTWDGSPMLFLVAGGLCLAFQYVSLGVALAYFQQCKWSKGSLPVFLAAVVAKVAVRLFFHSPMEVIMLGIIV